MKMKTLTAVLTAFALAVGMAACNRDNAGAGSSSDTKAKSGSAAGGSSARCADATAQRAGYRSRLFAVGRFAGEENRPIQGCRELFARALAVHSHIAVATARVRIGTPVVHVGGRQFSLGAAAEDRLH